jgi:hypothetical protein
LCVLPFVRCGQRPAEHVEIRFVPANLLVALSAPRTSSADRGSVPVHRT